MVFSGAAATMAGMSLTTMLVLNAILSGAVFVALALVFRLAHRLPQERRAETLHPSQPIALALAREHDERDLARAA